jgi:hypothetical protein
MKHSLNYLKQNAPFNKPILLFFQMNSMVYHQIKTKPFNLILNKFKEQNIKNIILAPILTDSMSNVNHRIEQVKTHIDNANLKYNNNKLHILCYSMASLPIHGYIHKYNGGKSIDSVLFLSSPNQ